MVEFGGFYFDPAIGQLRGIDGRPKPLRAQSIQVLAVLAARPNEIVSKEELFDAVWPEVSVTDDSLTQCIVDIRKAIGDTGRTVLKTIPKKGYQLVATPLKPARAERTSRLHWAVVVALSVTAVLLVAVFAGTRLWQAQTALETAEVRTPSIIVLPFQDLSPDGNMGHFADAMTEDLIVELTRWKEFRVVDRVTAMQFKDKPGDARTITAQVNANYALQGSIRRLGDQMRITAQLVDGETGQNLWAERYDEVGPDILQLQDGVIARIDQTLIGNQGVVRADEYRKSWRKAMVSLDEYDYYLRGHDKFYEYKKTSVQEAITIWQDGLKKHPDSGLLKIKLGWGYELCILINCAHPDATTQAVLKLAHEGMESANLPTAGHRFGLWLLSSVLSRQGKTEEVLKLVDEAISTYPADTEAFVTLTDDLAYVGAFDTIEDLLATVADRDWSRLSARTDAAIGSVAYMKGDCAAAVVKFKDFRALFLYEIMHAGCLAELGQTDKAWEMLDQIGLRFGVRSVTDFPIWFHRNAPLKNRVLSQLEPLGWPE